MRLSSVKPGDLVRVDGRLAYVDARTRGRLAIRWAHGASGIRTVGARSVEAAWRRIANGKRGEDRETS